MYIVENLEHRQVWIAFNLNFSHCSEQFSSKDLIMFAVNAFLECSIGSLHWNLIKKIHMLICTVLFKKIVLCNLNHCISMNFPINNPKCFAIYINQLLEILIKSIIQYHLNQKYFITQHSKLNFMIYQRMHLVPNRFFWIKIQFKSIALNTKQLQIHSKKHQSIEKFSKWQISCSNAQQNSNA